MFIEDFKFKVAGVWRILFSNAGFVFLGGGKLFCLFICKHLLHSCLMNGQYVLWFLQTKLESFNLLLHDYTFSTCTQSAADTYYGYIQIQNIWLATNYKLWHSLHKCIKHQFIQTTFYPHCYTHTVIPTCPLVALKHHMKDSHCSFVSSEKVEFFSFQALKPAEYSIEYGVHQTKATLSVQLTRVVKIFKLELHFRSLLKKISVWK